MAFDDKENKNLENANVSDEELQKMIEEMQDSINEYSYKADEICKKMSLTREQMANYINDPKNFSSTEWNILQKAKAEVDEFKEKIWEIFGKDIDVVNQYQAKKDLKKRRRKLLSGSNKKNWIQVS